jgi:hypothetical protein
MKKREEEEEEEKEKEQKEKERKKRVELLTKMRNCARVPNCITVCITGRAK